VATEVSPVPRVDVRFPSGELTCAAWLYRVPEPAPCVVMAHGFAAIKEGGLAAFAERFQTAGYNALVFDYRHFGASDGEPRQLVHVRRQLADWTAAVDYASALDGATKIAVWGSSFAGGHVLEIAARDTRVAAAIAQVPHTSGIASCWAEGVGAIMRLGVAATRDLAAAVRRADPYTVKTVGPPGALAAMTTPDAEPGYRAMFPPELSYRDDVAARIFLTLPLYSPGRRASRIRCPLLVQVAERDAVTPPAPAIRAARRAPQGELIVYPGAGHFDVYGGETLERVVADQITFLERSL
jgi:fermentation-respiration switch protein FrsA (DUF1100 family)